MAKFHKKAQMNNQNKNTKNVKKELTRKERRKEERRQKKTKKNEYFSKKKNASIQSEKSKKPDDSKTVSFKLDQQKNQKESPNKSRTTEKQQTVSDSLIAQRNKEKKQQRKLERQMNKRRQKQMKEANNEEDREIEKLEKQLKLHKRKTTSIPKSFAADGLDYLLEFCDPETRAQAVSTEKHLADETFEADFDEDFAIATGKHKLGEIKITKNKTSSGDMDVDSDFDENDSITEDEIAGLKGDNSDLENQDCNSEDEENDNSYMDIDSDLSGLGEEDEEVDFDSEESEEFSDDGEVEEFDGEVFDDSEIYIPTLSPIPEETELDINGELSDYEPGKFVKLQKSPSKRKNEIDKLSNKKLKNSECIISECDKNSKNKIEKNEGLNILKENENMNEEHSKDDEEYSENDNEISKNDDNKTKDNLWEDIYGRMRDKEGNVVERPKEKYIPPAVRARLVAETASENSKHSEKLKLLQRQMNGLFNRLTENNMQNIASQLEQLYAMNSRYDVNSTLASIVIKALVTFTLSAERIVSEHALLIALLHANIDTEIGAQFLQTIVNKFDTLCKEDQPIENKELENVVHIIAQLYNFKLFNSKLIHEIISKLIESKNKHLTERSVECLLLLLRTVGPTLRKDDPIALKDTILRIHEASENVPKSIEYTSRLKFMLDILLAIKNNNLNKIPNYDPERIEHLRKILRNFIRKGNYVTQLNISFEDLLKADERGRWWIVGSAWSNSDQTNAKMDPKAENKSVTVYSKQLLELARKQRMNTDLRRTVFCILMSAEDYLDAFEKLLRLGLKAQQEIEVIHVLIHCLLQENVYNPYYAVLAQKFCDYERKYQLTIRNVIRDKLKTLNECTNEQITNLAKLLTHLLLQGGLRLSVLEAIQLNELDKPQLRLMRQILLAILLNEDIEEFNQVWEHIAAVSKFQVFRQGLKLFIQHFLLRNTSTKSLIEKDKKRLEERGKLALKILSLNDKTVKF